MSNTREPASTGWFTDRQLGATGQVEVPLAELRDTALDAAVASQKIAATSRAAWSSDFDRDPEATMALLDRLPDGAAFGAGLLGHRPGGLFGGRS